MSAHIGFHGLDAGPMSARAHRSIESEFRMLGQVVYDSPNPKMVFRRSDTPLQACDGSLPLASGLDSCV